MQMLIKGGRVIDPGVFDGLADIWIKDGKIAGVLPSGAEEQTAPGDGPGQRVIDARGLLVVPGLVDMHVHLREPGQ